MALLEDKWTRLNEILMREAPAMEGLGLLNGKMGVCLYFFYLARETGKSEHLIFAETLLDEVYEAIQHQPIACGFGDGLAGISWALAHLINERFVEADTDDVLSDADDQIYQYIVNAQELSFGFLDGLLGYAAYLVSRLEMSLDTPTERNFVFKRLLVNLLNLMSQAVDEKKLRLTEPPILNLNWDLPLLLILLCKAKNLPLYENKIARMIDNLAPSVLSYFPYQQGNRLYLLYALRHLPYQVLPHWERHATLIQDQFDLDVLLNKELKDKNIYFSNGLAGVSFLLKALSGSFLDQGNLGRIDVEMTDRIANSNYFDSITKPDSEVKASFGLMQGLAGIGMQFLFSLKGNKSTGSLSFLRLQ